MSAPAVKLGPISHVGLVVEDCEKAAALAGRTRQTSDPRNDVPRLGSEPKANEE